MGSSSQPTNTTQNVISQQQLPQWYSDYLQNMIGRASGEAAGQAPIYGQAPTNPGAAPTAPDPSQAQQDPAAYAAAQQKYTQDQANYEQQLSSYNAYQALTPDQQAMQGQRIAPMNAQQQLATDTVNGIQALPSAQAAVGDINASTQNSAIGAGAGYGQAGAGLIGQGATQNIAGALSPFIQQAMGYVNQGANTNLVGMASPYIQGAASPIGLSAASPYLNAASQSLPQATMNNLSPYLNGAMNSLSNQAAYDLQNKYLPAVNDSFISAGQFGSTRDQDITAQTVHDLSNSVMNQQSTLLNNAYGQAGQLAESNLGLQGQLGQTAGQLGTAQQQALLGAGSTLGTLGGAQAGLSLQGAGQVGALGQSLAGALGTQGQLGIQGGTALGNLGYQQGQLQASTNQNLQGAANLYEQNEQNAVNLPISQANAEMAIGNQQQQLQQTNLNTAYQDWINQTFYPQNQTSWLSNIVRGLPSQPAGYGSDVTTSNPTNTGAQVGGLLTAGLSLSGGTGGGAGGTGSYGGYYRSGGKVRKFKVGGRVAYQSGGQRRGLGQFGVAA